MIGKLFAELRLFRVPDVDGAHELRQRARRLDIVKFLHVNPWQVVGCGHVGDNWHTRAVCHVLDLNCCVSFFVHILKGGLVQGG